VLDRRFSRNTTLPVPVEARDPFKGGRDVRGFRPSRFGSDEEDEDVQRAKQTKMRIYAERAKAKLPLFTDPLTGKSYPFQRLAGEGGE
jgi:hypothetical protein